MYVVYIPEHNGEIRTALGRRESPEYRFGDLNFSQFWRKKHKNWRFVYFLTVFVDWFVTLTTVTQPSDGNAEGATHRRFPFYNWSNYTAHNSFLDADFVFGMTFMQNYCNILDLDNNRVRFVDFCNLKFPTFRSELPRSSNNKRSRIEVNKCQKSSSHANILSTHIQCL
jgi:hypothetical protein